MALYKRNGVWWYHFIFEGRHIQRSSKVGNKSDARTIEAAYLTKLAKGEVGIEEPKKIPSFSQAMKDFLKWSEQQYATHPNTHRRYEISSKALLRFFGNKPLDRITSGEVEKFITWRARQKKAPAGKKAKSRQRQQSNSVRPPLIVSWLVSGTCSKTMKTLSQEIRSKALSS